VTDLARKTFSLPRRGALLLTVVVLGPLVAMDLYFLVRYPVLRGHPIFHRMLLRIAAPLPIALLAWLLRVPVAVDTEGIRFAWFLRANWTDITDVTIRSRLGMRILVVSRRNGFTWQPWLYLYDGLPEFLAKHAPEDNPMRKIRDLTGGSRPSHSDAG
jgi:hypothetical protein